jgi:hypothetical protein
MWVKRNEIVRQQMLFSAYNNSLYDTEAFFDGDKLNFRNKRNGSFVFQVKTNRLFRDVNAWYHLVFQFHASGDSGVYAKIFVNGIQETDLNVNTQGSGETTWNNDKSHSIGSTVNGGADHFNGIISHMHFASTGIYAPTVFGEYDANGVWKIKTSPTFTLGSNGFTILKDGNTITDQSTNSNDFSLGAGTLTNTEDSPSNVFATLNPLAVFLNTSGHTYSNGNNTVATNGSGNDSNPSSTTLGITTGKWYWETKFVSLASGTAYALTGIMAKAPATAGNYLGGYDDTYGYAGWNGTVYNNGGSTGNTSGLATYTTGDILSIALDADNNRLYYYKNGAIQNSGTGIVIPDAADTEFGVWFPAVGDWGNTSHVWSCNFGNGYFGTTAVASAGTNASGNGIFEYDVPTGYTALSTKGLNL